MGVARCGLSTLPPATCGRWAGGVCMRVLHRDVQVRRNPVAHEGVQARLESAVNWAEKHKNVERRRQRLHIKSLLGRFGSDGPWAPVAASDRTTPLRTLSALLLSQAGSRLCELRLVCHLAGVTTGWSRPAQRWARIAVCPVRQRRSINHQNTHYQARLKRDSCDLRHELNRPVCAQLRSPRTILRTPFLAWKPIQHSRCQ